MPCTRQQWKQIEEYVFDHYEHFDCYPADAETSDGTVVTLEEFLPFIEEG